MNDFALPSSLHGIDDLLRWKSRSVDGADILNVPEKLRYAIYLRKSTEDDGSQVRSLGDQRKACLKLARDLGVQVKDEDILEESGSAKVSGRRDVFTKMLRGFQTGVYQGLISWAPDRLSRNMKEAGEIIELIDMGYIRELKFCTYQFDNTPNGKMMLGILFATSKQYSDKLSVDVIRGNTGNITEGKYNGSLKKGYYISDAKHFYPDIEYWKLLRRGVEMRLYEKKTNVEVAKFLDEAGIYVRKSPDEKGRRVKLTNQSLGKMFEDTFYCGLFQFGQTLTSLCDIYDFVPLMTVDEYITLNKKIAEDFSITPADKKKLNKSLEYGLLRDKVICDYCDGIMKFQNTRVNKGVNAGKWVVTYYCRNTKCERYNKGNGIKHSIRAYILAHAIYQALEACTIKSKEAYKMHIASLEIEHTEKRAILRRKLRDAKVDLRVHSERFGKAQELALQNPERYDRHFDGQLEHLKEVIDLDKSNIAKNESELEILRHALPTEEEFFKLVDAYLKTLRETTDVIEQDAIYSKVVSNLRVRNDSVSVIKLNPPYNLMADLSKIPLGWG